MGATSVKHDPAETGGIEVLLPFRGRRRHSDYAWLTPSQQAVRGRIDSVRTALPGRHRSGAES